MASTRKPAVAGVFYPDQADELRQTIASLLHDARSTAGPPKAIIAPHAGYIYSGPIAASAYAHLAAIKDTVSRVVLLGPSHRVPFYGLATSRASDFVTPLGSVPVDQDSVARLLTLPQVKSLEEAHAMEHSLEVQLPFLQSVLGAFSVVPLVVGEASADEVSEVLEMMWGGPETLIVISSDLSHYHDYDTARRMDRATSQAIEQLAPEKLHYEDACGRIPISGLLQAARHHHLHAVTVDQRNSGDTAGPRDQVVGYGAYVFTADG
jgi:hypothetical protein